MMTRRQQNTTTKSERPNPPLRDVRLSQGRSLRDVADAAGVDYAHLSKVERGQHALSVDTLYRLARALGLRELAKLLAPYAAERR
jgi:transcriptional regulator with XRE-family HTH domain